MTCSAKRWVRRPLAAVRLILSRPGRGADGLVAAYRSTRYVVADSGGEATARIDCHEPAIDALLRRHGATSGVFITAWNPRSVVLPRTDNDAAARRLQSRLAGDGLRALPHRGLSADPAWQPEEGLFVLDMGFDDAVRLAAEFGQNAIAAVRLGEPAMLLFTPLMDHPAPA